MYIEITDVDVTETSYSYSWSGDILTIRHNLNGRVLCALYEASNVQSSLLPTYVDDDTISYDFAAIVSKPSAVDSWSLLVSTPLVSATPVGSDGVWTHEYYAGTINEVMLFCKSLNVGGGRLSKVTDNSINYYMGLVNDFIDGYLNESYFLPIRKYNRVLPNGTLEKVFPGKVRLCAIQWTAGLILCGEFQTQEPNINEMGNKLIEEARKEIFQMTLWNMRIPGQRFKSNVSKTMPPGMMPPWNPETTW